jgi:UrcA family protein
MKTGLISIAAIAFAASAANAGPIVVSAASPPTAHVAYSDLDLASSAGKARLEGRIRAAAESLCVTRGDGSLEALLGGRSCYRSAVASGLQQMNKLVQQQAASSQPAQSHASGR